jgi:hypothetical protein
MSIARCGRLAILSLLVAEASLCAQGAPAIFQTTSELVLVDGQALQTRTRTRPKEWTVLARQGYYRK